MRTGRHRDENAGSPKTQVLGVHAKRKPSKKFPKISSTTRLNYITQKGAKRNRTVAQSCQRYQGLFLSTQLESNPNTSVLSGSCHVKAKKSCTPSGASYAVTFPSPRSRTSLCFNVLTASRIRSAPPETKKVSGNPLKDIVDSMSGLIEAGERYGFFVGPSLGSP